MVTETSAAGIGLIQHPGYNHMEVHRCTIPGGGPRLIQPLIRLFQKVADRLEEIREQVGQEGRFWPFRGIVVVGPR